MAKLTFLIGKGGVGKTTVAAAYAMRQADVTKGPVLLLSTDPAHSLSDVFQERFSGTPRAIKSPRFSRLFVAEVNAGRRFRNFIADRKQELLSLLERGSIFSKEEITPFLEASLPGMAEICALIAIRDALSCRKYSAIVVDTAPFGHTLRLFELPRYFEGFLNFLELAASREKLLAQHFGGLSRFQQHPKLIDDWKEALQLVQSALHDTGELVLVTTPEKFALNESFRCAAILQQSSFKISAVVLNRMVSRGSQCRICRQKSQASTVAKAALRRKFSQADFYVAEDVGSPVLGPANLKKFAAHVFGKKPAIWGSTPPKSSKVKLTAVHWPELRSKLTLVSGKGGVGKTTLSAALGAHHRQLTNESVDICSVDPAPSLDDVFQAEVDDEFRPVLGDAKLRAAELDSAAEFQEWAQKVKRKLAAAMNAQVSGVHIDLSFERGLFEQLLDSVPPGVDELFSVFRMQEMLSSRSGKLLIDMAPTGHALELLRTPERLLAWTRLLLKTLAAEPKLAFIQDAAVEIAELGQRTRALLKVLNNRTRTKIYVVMLPESLPDRETARLVRDLGSLGLAIEAIFINRVMLSKHNNCSRCKTASQWQMMTLYKVCKQYPETTILIAKDFPYEISGSKRLQSFTRELWRLQ